jgi:exodeoxyribonuclease-3
VLRVATLNLNGVRAARRRGFDDWLATRGCDVVALQEVRAPLAALPADAFGDHHVVYEPGQVPGRNGVAVLTREPPAAVRTWDADVLVRAPGEDHLHTEPAPDDVPLARGLARHAHEGRYVEVDLAGAPLTVASLYLPKGGLPAHLQVPARMREAPDGGARYDRKMRFLAAFARQLARTRRAAAARGREFLLLGDLNVAHTRLDVARWRRVQTSEGFLPEERAWIAAQLSPRTLVDVVRALHPGEEGPYSWWSWLPGAHEADTGWRIDYHLATPRLARTAARAVVDRDHRGVRLSDHAPVVVDYDLSALTHPPARGSVGA